MNEQQKSNQKITDITIDKLHNQKCICGREKHLDDVNLKYFGINDDYKYVIIKKQLTKNTFNEIFKDGQKAWNFFLNQQRIFKKQTCIFTILHMIGVLTNEERKETINYITEVNRNIVSVTNMS